MKGALLWLGGALAAALVSLALTRLLISTWFWHPLGYCPHSLGPAWAIKECKSYNFWSGSAGSFLTSLPGWFVALAVYLRTHNCHQPGCFRLIWHEHPEHGHPVCRRHHPHADPEHEIWSQP